MKKVIRLTESDLTRIVKRVLRENEEQQMTDEVTNLILSNISKEDLIALGQLYNSLGEDEFTDVAEDVVDSVIEGDTVSESIGFSKGRITVSNEAEKDKLEATKIITRLATTMVSLIAGAITLNTLNPQHQDIDAAMVTGIVTASMIGANLLSRIPHKIAAKPLPEKLKNSRIVKLVDDEMKKINLKGKELGDVVNHFVKLGYPEEMITNFILNWMDKNNVNIKEKRRVKLAK
jgi:hypothetical protein